jgi:undecaprenyl phosphate N,N'-diacetylbacillosamine 1-phosphate transferase
VDASSAAHVPGDAPLVLARGPWARGGKRLFDIAAALLLPVVLLPLLIAITIAIVVESPGTPFFVDDRVGKGGRRFRMWKFRSMVPDAPSHALRRKTMMTDPRITRVGRLLRRFGLDELPQLGHILAGQMSIVGPRPALWEHYAQFTPEQCGRLLVRPGVTGLAQVSGRNLLTWAERIELDLTYVRRLSLALDFRILIATVRTVLLGEGLYSIHQQRDTL